jgi:hypothetical protein
MEGREGWGKVHKSCFEFFNANKRKRAPTERGVGGGRELGSTMNVIYGTQNDNLPAGKC